ncbi:hypothetical protein LOTGIDRAFT_174709 [Lottia gigantea]|uniref:Uncharacterized protein n=1 Tax=Lottia gigantea TaxID=225164 RepID=V4ASN6_LOTGI|nr:hypothetical protein LOTGIDRAFT_174709 [Lottia gigantea]ESO96756.1 hypothetical protein LOTGIDRAFT_174709 [Lottia gigantea]
MAVKTHCQSTIRGDLISLSIVECFKQEFLTEIGILLIRQRNTIRFEVFLRMNGFVVPKSYDQSRTLELLKALRIESFTDLEIEARDISDKSRQHETKSARNNGGKSNKLIPINEMINGYGSVHQNKPRVRHTQTRKRMIVVEESELRLNLQDVVCEDDGYSDVDLTTDRETDVKEVDKTPRRESRSTGQRIKRFLTKYLCSFYDYSM